MLVVVLYCNLDEFMAVYISLHTSNITREWWVKELEVILYSDPIPHQNWCTLDSVAGHEATGAGVSSLLYSYWIHFQYD